MDLQKQTTMLLVGGKEITCFAAKDYCSSTGKGTPITDALGKISDLKDLNSSQTGENLRLWYTTQNDAVHYYTTVTSALSDGVLIPLLPEKEGGRVSGLLSLKSRQEASDMLVSSLLSVDENGNLFLLQQDSVSYAWNKYPFWYAAEKNVMEVKGYMLRMHTTIVKDPNNPTADADTVDLIPGCWLYVSSSGVVRCIINGKNATVSPTPEWYQTDAKGVLNILLQTEDATCHQFSVDRFQPVQATSMMRQKSSSGGERALGDPLLDPSEKVVDKLKDIKTEEQLRGLRKSDGTPVVGPDVPADDVKAAVEAFQQLSERALELHSDQKQRQATYMAAISSGQSLGGDIVPFGFLSDIGDAFEGAWHWVEGAVEDAWEWGCHFIGQYIYILM